MIDVKQAVEAAANYVGDLFAGEKIVDVRLEEVELSEGDDFWNVTLSFLRRPEAASDVLVPLGMKREYKMFVIRSADGKVKSMKIRHLAWQIPSAVSSSATAPRALSLTRTSCSCTS